MCNTLPYPHLASFKPQWLEAANFQHCMYVQRCSLQCYSTHCISKVLILQSWWRHFSHLCIHNIYHIYSTCIIESIIYIYKCMYIYAAIVFMIGCAPVVNDTLKGKQKCWCSVIRTILIFNLHRRVSHQKTPFRIAHLIINVQTLYSWTLLEQNSGLNEASVYHTLYLVPR